MTKSIRPARGGFTLVELLVVMGIMVILMTLATVALRALMGSSTLNIVGQSVGNSISLARQEAVTSNVEVQVRFYKMPGDSGTSQWSAMQLWGVAETVNGPVEKPIGNLLKFAPQIIVSDDATLSPLLGADAAVSGTQTIPKLADVQYKGFRIRPSGSLDASVTPDKSFLTLRALNAPLGAKGVPVNYYSIQITPLTGAIQIYRP